MTLDFGMIILAHLLGDYVYQNDWMAQNKTKSHLACLTHVVLYTTAFFTLISAVGAVWPFWAYVAIAASHYPVDRYGLAKKWMTHVSGQKGFAEHLAPWSVIIVDNTYHLVCALIVFVAVGAL